VRLADATLGLKVRTPHRAESELSQADSSEGFYVYLPLVPRNSSIGGGGEGAS
jgi:hypothetical protein